MKLFHLIALLAASMGYAGASAQSVEPKDVKTPSAVKPGEGVVRLSLRTQRQFIETAYLYFVEVLPDGTDGKRTLKFERGAGVPIMGTNMIDTKPKLYRVPQGRYRLLAYTVACATVPPPNTVCRFYGNAMPTERYDSGSPDFSVAAGALTDAGDFIIEYTGTAEIAKLDLFSERFDDDRYGVRWKPIATPLPASFAALPTSPAPVVAERYRSRIQCAQRPKTLTVQFPFICG